MLANLAMPLLPNTALMIPVWAINGFAQAMLWPPIVRILADNLDHDRFVTANLIVTMAAHAATILLYLYVPLCLQFMTWRAVFFTATIITCITLVIFAVSMLFVTLDRPHAPRKKEETLQKAPERGGFFAIFLQAGLVPIFFAIIAMGFLRDGIESWLPTLYGEAFGRTASESILVSALLPVFSILSVTIIKFAHKTRLFYNESSGSTALFLAAAILCVPLAVLINFEQTALRLVCLVIAALICGTMHAVNFLYISCLPGRFAAHGRAATASGFCNAFTYVGAAISMYGIAAVTEWLGWSATAISWILVAVLGALCSLAAWRKYTAFLKENA
jgi:OPA family glycerol-3-phosphate transporter-like MFS transporter